MRAAIINSPGGPEQIEIIEVAPPIPGPGETLLKVAAAAINPVDLATRAGVFHQAGVITSVGSIGLGWDVAGAVVAHGPDVEDAIPVGTRVAALAVGMDRPLGSHADYVIVPASSVAVIPNEISDVDAASIPLNTLTAAQALDIFGAARDRTLLITGAAGAVGCYAAQLATALGWRVTGLARRTDAALLT
ncbi:hypothetical protein GOEFS_036_00760 [Gordonia effusa NBRC 100432]|uniref:Alcohol dehydrogenase-like N-terminal domain-containing protein n=1 Tax=Gordonia effusa NBRC 100432 TaxID=1077974 RepID=H0QXT6_9ACTN|nr:hypothetical protein [Gordonia effusa]GAB17637.1 hypothetical protein GOEFS_036_00760 [Gordonia effusa NBRC 100432]